MRVLVTWGSRHGGTEGIAGMIGQALRDAGLDVDVLPADEASKAADFDAAIVGGALYANRWHPDAKRFVLRQQRKLRSVPVWFFSSGPLEDSPRVLSIPPTRQVRALMDRVGALGHVTFGGRLPPDAQGFPASAMAKKHAGDYRHPERIRAWAFKIAHELPTAHPGVTIAQPGRSWARLFLHATAGWALCAAIMGGLLRIGTLRVALAVHALAVPIVFAFVAWHYFHKQDAHDPLPTAFAFTGTVAILDLVVVAGITQHSLAMFRSVVGTWLPFASIFAVTWGIGAIMSTMPWTEPSRAG